jgi:hypothetical protein
MRKVSEAVCGGLYKVVLDVMSDAVKKTLMN